MTRDSADSEPGPRPREAMGYGKKRRRSLIADWPLSAYLVLFGIAVTLPVLLFSGYLISLNDEAERAARAADLVESAESATLTIDREIANGITTLRILARSPALDSRQYDEFHARATGALLGTGAYVILLDPALNQLLNTRVPHGTPLGQTSDPQSAEEAVQSRGIVVSNLFRGGVSQQFVFNIVFPVVRGGQVEHVLILTRDAAWLAELLARQHGDGNWTVTVVDRDNRIMARTPADDDAVGGDLPQDLVLVSTGTAGIGTAAGGDGTPLVTAWHRSDVTGWRTYVSVPEAIFEEPLRSSRRLLALGGLALLGLSVALAFVFGRFMAQPINALRGAARALGAGDLVAPLDSDLREANEVGDALAAASEERRQREAHIDLLMRELAHRAKNQLAVVQALAQRTARSSEGLEDFQSRFLARLQGLARSIEVLAEQNWKGAPLHDLVRAQLTSFVDVDRGRVTIDGPRLLVRPSAAERIGLALHELATNASKYGALSAPAGTLSITWSFDRTEGDERFRMRWQEAGGPPVSPPAHKGFGHVVIDRMLAEAMDATVAMTFESPGFTWEMTCPAEVILN